MALLLLTVKLRVLCVPCSHEGPVHKKNISASVLCLVNDAYIEQAAGNLVFVHKRPYSHQTWLLATISTTGKLDRNTVRMSCCCQPSR
jgi:hypothetical protein